MTVFERLITLFTPDECMICDAEGLILCEACRASEILPLGSSCYRCGALTRDFSTCKSCLRHSPLARVWVASVYEEASRRIIHELKFEARRGAITSVAEQMLRCLPLLDGHIITFLPTASDHLRSRGFDQTKLIARYIGQRCNLPVYPLLYRNLKSHQVGASRSERINQIKNAFSSRSEHLIRGSKILLVDDVMTTGASMEEAARQLRKAGAREVSGVVFAR